MFAFNFDLLAMMNSLDEPPPPDEPCSGSFDDTGCVLFSYSSAEPHEPIGAELNLVCKI